MNDIDDDYRRASAQDAGGPADSTRRNILAHAAELAAQRAAEKAPVSADFGRPAANQSSWQPALIGTLAAACLAGLLVTPLFLTPRGTVSPVTPDTVSGNTQSMLAPQAPSHLAAVPPVSTEVPAPTGQGRQVERSTDIVGRPDATDTRAPGFIRAPEPATAPRRALPPQFTDETSNFVSAPESAARAAPARSNSLQQRSFMAGANSADSARQKSFAAAESGGVAAPVIGLRQAAAAGDLARLQELLAEPIDIDARDDHGRTALMLAIVRGNSAAVDVLLAHGADANAADSDGLTPLQAAMAGTHPGITAALQRAGAR